MVRKLKDYTKNISSGTTKKSCENGKYVLYGSTGPIGHTDKAYYSGKKVLVARVGANAGTVNIVDGDYGVSDNTLIVDFNDGINVDYMFYQLSYANPKKLMFGSGQPLITAGLLKNMDVWYPKNSQQIVTVLSDVDMLIESLERLITKKREIKHGAMQELLSGQRRLPGYSKKWKTINISKCFTLKARIGWQGLTTEEYLEHGDAYLITGTDFCKGRINWDTCHYVNNDRYDQDKNIQIVNGDVLMTKDGTIGKVALVTELNSKATLNSGVFLIRTKYPDEYCGDYIYHVLSSEIFRTFLDKLSAGSTINHLYQKDFVKFDCLIPEDVKEQVAIAECLNTMDEELSILERKLVKYKNIYRGMMQELLSGRKRSD